MTPRLIIEVLDGREGVRSRSRIELLPATIGRGYASDVIVDDPYVCPTHVRISETEHGELVAEDAGSVNGLRVDHGAERVARVLLRPGMELTIGRSIVRCAYPDQPVPAARVDLRRPQSANAWLGSALGRAATIGGALLLLALSAYAGSTERHGVGDAATTAIGVFVLLTLWSGAWALASRVVSQRFAFTRHLAFAALLTAAVTAYGVLNEWIVFLAPYASVSTVLTAPAGLASVAFLLYGHLGIASTMARAQRLRAALTITGIIAAIGMTFGMVDSRKFTTKMSYQPQLKPAPVALVPTTSIEQFVANARALQDAVDRLAADSSASAAHP